MHPRGQGRGGDVTSLEEGDVVILDRSWGRAETEEGLVLGEDVQQPQPPQALLCTGDMGRTWWGRTSCDTPSLLLSVPIAAPCPHPVPVSIPVPTLCPTSSPIPMSHPCPVLIRVPMSYPIPPPCPHPHPDPVPTPLPPSLSPTDGDEAQEPVVGAGEVAVDGRVTGAQQVQQHQQALGTPS